MSHTRYGLIPADVADSLRQNYDTQQLRYRILEDTDLYDDSGERIPQTVACYVLVEYDHPDPVRDQDIRDAGGAFFDTPQEVRDYLNKFSNS